MRLIDTTTCKLCWFAPRDVPEYAILSHTWGPKESTLQEFAASKKKSKIGYKKIIRAIKMARSEHHRFIWVDSCCIDRTNPDEMNEAINFMYTWYANSKVCYVFLDDLSKKSPTSQITNCRWFARGWTLQELVASRNVRFYDANGFLRGTKQSFVDAISKRTNIPQTVLLNLTRPSEFPVACIMSWAANRNTAKIEDEAYCLMGLFGIHLNVVYGEGHKAFRRLQEEILQRRGDLTQLAWSLPTSHPQVLQTNGAQPSYQKLRNVLIQPRPTLPCLFAPSADCFSNSTGLFPFANDISNYRLTNRGLFVAGPLALRIAETRPPAGQSPGLSHFMVLVGKQGDHYIGLYLLKIGPDLFCRNWDMGLARLMGEEVLNMRQFSVSSWYVVVDHEGVNAAIATIYRNMCVHFPVKGAANEFVQVKDTVPSALWDVHDRVFLRPNTYRGGQYEMALGLRLFFPLISDTRAKPRKDPNQLLNGLDFVVLCKFRQRQEVPQCFVLTAEEYPREVETIFTPQSPNASLIWPDLEMAFPRLMEVSDSAVIPTGALNGTILLYRVSAKVVLENAQLVSQEAPVFSIYLDIVQWQPNTRSRLRS